MVRRVLLILWFLAVLIPLAAQNREPAANPAGTGTGDAVAAGFYADWAIAALTDGRWAAAEAALERARDFAGVSSDVSYLLALVRSHENRPCGAILDAVLRSLDTNRWNRYTPAQARFLEAETLLRVRAFTETLRVISLIPDAEAERYGADIACLRLRALLGLGDIPAFHSAMALALERYPRDTRPAQMLFRYAANKAVPEGGERVFVDTILKRLPMLLDEAPELAYLAAPFIRDTEEARRLVAAYRAAGGAGSEAIPVALNLGIIDETAAMEELFRQSVMDKDLILGVWKLLRTSDSQENFRRNLTRFSGVIQEDGDHDGYAEVRTRYSNGIIEEYSYDVDQDGLFDWRIFWNAGIPTRAEIALSPGAGADTPQTSGITRGAGGPGGAGTALAAGTGDIQGVVRLPLDDDGLAKVSLLWERYPALLRAGLGELTYGFNPWEFSFAPFLIAEIPGNDVAGLLYPEPDPLGARLTWRALTSFAATIERPSREFRGAVERITLKQGIPSRAEEYIEGRKVAVTEFLQGRPAIQHVDLDLDGRMETLRRFRPEAGNPGQEGPFVYAAVLGSSESDWDGDGIYETGEEYLPDGLTARSWDLDKDGNREYTVISP
jgi:hypothetical protein